MAEPLFEYVSAATLETDAVATGHVATRMEWVEVDGKRRPGDKPALSDQGKPMHEVHVMLPLGRDGAPVVMTVTVASFEVPTPDPYRPVAFEGLRVRVRAHRSGKGVEVTFTADGVRSAGPAAAATDKAA